MLASGPCPEPLGPDRLVCLVQRPRGSCANENQSFPGINVLAMEPYEYGEFCQRTGMLARNPLRRRG